MTENTPQCDDLLLGFIHESIDALQDLSEQLELHRDDPADAEPINMVFRAVHSIKGNAGFFGLIAIKKFSHSLENTLDEVRTGVVDLSEDLQLAFVDGFDILEELLHEVPKGVVQIDLTQREEDQLTRVAEAAEQSRCEQSEESKLANLATKLSEEILAAGLEQSASWAEQVLALVPSLSSDDHDGNNEEEGTPEFFAKQIFVCNGEDTSSLIQPLFDLFLKVKDGSYKKEDGENYISNSQKLSQWLDEKGFSDEATGVEQAMTDFRTIYDSSFDLDENLLSIIWDKLLPAVTPFVVENNDSSDDSAQPEKSSEAPEEKVREEVAQEQSGDEGEKPEQAKSRFLRVKEHYVDTFLDDVSSLFITCERLKDVQRRLSQHSKFSVAMDDLVEELRQVNTSFSEQTSVLQNSVVALRKVPIRGLFNKFPRLARSLASKLNKKINVTLEGAENEVDKALCEDLDAPLTHMIRNVCDHGIETPEERALRGVPETGTLQLKCELTRTHVHVTVQDDGQGIDPDRIGPKAVEKGVVTQEQLETMSKEDIINLIFHPGFSTAEQVSDVSGRGVGMDVVRTNLREHDGNVRVSSEVGVGTCFDLTIPVRQAVLVVDGLLIKQGEGTFVIPFEHINEIINFETAEITRAKGKQVIKVRGEPYAAVNLSELLDLEEEQPEDDSSILQQKGVLVGSKLGTACILVEEILGQRKVVVNNLEEIVPGAKRLSGVAQLGGGQLALVLSPEDLIDSLRDELQEKLQLDELACQKV
ncbi:MAG: chemotaxis protein CheA [Pirellulaceae bacterium]|nr:chemotaxis protein CheA [Pirellulaceae bacterium]